MGVSLRSVRKDLVQDRGFGGWFGEHLRKQASALDWALLERAVGYFNRSYL